MWRQESSFSWHAVDCKHLLHNSFKSSDFCLVFRGYSTLHFLVVVTCEAAPDMNEEHGNGTWRVTQLEKFICDVFLWCIPFLPDFTCRHTNRNVELLTTLLKMLLFNRVKLLKYGLRGELKLQAGSESHDSRYCILRVSFGYFPTDVNKTFPQFVVSVTDVVSYCEKKLTICISLVQL